MNYLYFINQGVFTAIEAVIYLFAFCTLSGKRDYFVGNIGKSLIFILFYTIFTYWATEFVPFGIHTVLILVFTALCLNFFTKTNLYASLGIMIIIFIFVLVLESAVMIAAMLILDGTTSTVLDNQVTMLVCTIIVKLVETAVVIIMYRLNTDKYSKLKFPNKELDLPNIIFIQAFLVGVIAVSVNYAASKPDKLIVYTILIFCIFLLFIGLAILDFTERSRLSSLRNKYVLQQEHIKNIESIINIIRKEKHDFYNHLNTIYGLCSLNKPDMSERIKQYIKNTTGTSYFSYKSIDTGNDYIDALIAVKMNYAIDKEVSFKLDIRAPLCQVDIDDKELVAIFANVIDNAFDAVLSEPKDGDMCIYVTTYIIENAYYISIKNNGPAIPEKNLRKIFTDGFSTKANSTGDHGFGLYIVQQGVSRNGGAVTVTSNEQETEFLIKLRVKRNKNEEDCREVS